MYVSYLMCTAFFKTNLHHIPSQSQKMQKRNNSKSLGAKNHSALTKQQTNFGYNVSSPRHNSGG
jgi:hypothetical protein